MPNSQDGTNRNPSLRWLANIMANCHFVGGDRTSVLQTLDTDPNPQPIAEEAFQPTALQHLICLYKHKKHLDHLDGQAHMPASLSGSFFENQVGSLNVSPSAIGKDFNNIFLTCQKKDVSCTSINSKKIDGKVKPRQPATQNKTLSFLFCCRNKFKPLIFDLTRYSIAGFKPSSEASRTVLAQI